jgi:hypothetical protein
VTNEGGEDPPVTQDRTANDIHTTNAILTLKFMTKDSPPGVGDYTVFETAQGSGDSPYRPLDTEEVCPLYCRRF